MTRSGPVPRPDPALAHAMPRGVAPLRLAAFGVGAGREQQRRELRVVAIRGPVEGGGVVGRAVVDVGAGPEQPLHRGMVAGLRRVGQPALAPCRTRRQEQRQHQYHDSRHPHVSAP